MPLRIGAHVRGGLSRIVLSAREVDAEAIQIFASNPRGWARPNTEAAALERIGNEVRDRGLGPFFVHAPYLVNPASPNAAFLQRSVETLIWTFERSTYLRADGVVVHAGAAGSTPRPEALLRVKAALLPIAELINITMVIELTSGTSGSIASRWAHARELLETLEHHPKLRFCFDTCHAYSAGYDLSTAGGLRSCLDEMRREIGDDRLALVHANDSRDPLGSKRDRHEHLGRGTMGLDGFRALVRSSTARRVPIIVETPVEGQASDIATLRSLASG